MGCPGDLRPWQLGSGPEGDDRYRTVHQSMLPVSPAVREHTAQWPRANWLSLERDLSSAIHEYAPGSSIVAAARPGPTGDRPPRQSWNGLRDTPALG